MSILMRRDKYFEYNPQSSSSSYKILPEWSTIISSCKRFELFPNLKICHYINKLYLIIFDRPFNPEMSKLFDDFLFSLFILMFIGFLFISIYTIFVEERQSLKELRIKVKQSTDAIVGILRAFWILKEVKVQNLQLEEESKRIVKLIKNNNNDHIDHNLHDGSLNEDTVKNINSCNIDVDSERKIDNLNAEETIINGSEGDFIMPSKRISNRHLQSLPSKSKMLRKNGNKSERCFHSERNLAYGEPYRKTNIEHSAPPTPRRPNLNNNCSTGGGIFINRKNRIYDGRSSN